MGREYMSQHDWMSTFQLSAYDPDADDTVEFFLADWRKQGALMGNSIPEGTYPPFWYKEVYEARRLEAFNFACVNGPPGSGGSANCGNCPKVLSPLPFVFLFPPLSELRS
jgi:hypothetical protein